MIKSLVMTPHLHKKISIDTNQYVIVNVKGNAEVMLMDEGNYDLYCIDEDFDNFGKKAGAKPVLLKPPCPGEWHIVVEQTNPAREIFVNIQIVTEHR